MKKTLILIVIVLLVLIGLTGTMTLAQEIIEEPAPLVPEIVLPELPNPGILPGTFWYFLDGWGESVQEFFTFRAENRALLQTRRALERVAEINVLLERKGVDAPGLDIAEAKIQRNVARANEILERQKARGIEVAQLAKRLDNEFDTRQALLRGVFRTTKENLRTEEKALEAQIREARLAGNFERVEELRATLTNIENQRDRIGTRRDLLKERIEAQKERIRGKLEVREKELEILADEAENLFDQRERDLEQIFEQKKRVLGLQEKALEVQLRQAMLVGDTVLVEQIRTQLLELKNQDEVLEKEEEVSEEVLEQEKRGRLKGVMAMQERAANQIEEAKEKIDEVKEKMIELAETPTVVLELIRGAKSKLVVAEQAYIEGKYGQAFGQAMAVERLARNAKRILGEKGEDIEKLEKIEEAQEEMQEIKERKIERRIERGMFTCQTDEDCKELICPMVIGADTPQCHPERNICFCGPGRDFRGPEILEIPLRTR